MTFPWETIDKLSEACGYLFNNKFLADVQFRFPCGKVIYAHSLILSFRGSGFHDIFKNSKDNNAVHSILIDDVSYEIVHDLLKSLYESYRLVVSSNNCVDLLKLSHRYGIHDVIKTSTTITHQNIKVENVLEILEVSTDMQLYVIEQELLSFVGHHAANIFKLPKFVHIRKPVLDAILKWPYLNDSSITEFHIFDIVMKWARVACKKSGVTSNSATKREMLGDTIKLIRFPVMTAVDFAACCELEPKLLKDNEIAAIFLNISGGVTNSLGFLDYKRLNYNTKVIIREHSTTAVNSKMSTRFKVSKTIHLLGFTHDNGAKGKVTATISTAYGEEIYKDSYDTASLSDSYFRMTNKSVQIKAGQTYNMRLQFGKSDEKKTVGATQIERFEAALHRMILFNSQTVFSEVLTKIGPEHVEFSFTGICPYIEHLYYAVPVG